MTTSTLETSMETYMWDEGTIVAPLGDTLDEPTPPLAPP